MKYAFGKARIISNLWSGRRHFVLTGMKNTKLRKVIADVGNNVATRHGSFNRMLSIKVAELRYTLVGLSMVG